MKLNNVDLVLISESLNTQRTQVKFAPWKDFLSINNSKGFTFTEWQTAASKIKNDQIETLLQLKNKVQEGLTI